MWLLERIFQVKCLTITVDDMTVYSGEVFEFQWQENAEQICVTGRFKPPMGFIEQLKQAAATQAQQQQPQVVPPQPPTIPDGTVPPELRAVLDGDQE
jgi:hypothetical protein